MICTARVSDALRTEWQKGFIGLKFLSAGLLNVFQHKELSCLEIRIAMCTTALKS